MRNASREKRLESYRIGTTLGMSGAVLGHHVSEVTDTWQLETRDVAGQQRPTGQNLSSANAEIRWSKEMCLPFLIRTFTEPND